MSTPIVHPQVDVLCLGLGQMSGPVAAELSIAGYKVVGLDKGQFWDFSTDWAMPQVHDEWQMIIERKFDHPLYISTFTVRNNRNQMALPKRRYTKGSAGVLGHAVGGAATHYQANMGRAGQWTYQALSNLNSRYGPSQVANMLPSNHDLEDWPLTYAQYVPYYAAWEQAMGMAGTNQDPFSPNSDYPVAPHPTTPVGALFRDTTTAMGYHPFPHVSAIVSGPYMNQYGIPRNGCVYCGYCAGSTCNFQCEVGAKSSSHVSTIPAAVKSGNFEIRVQSYVFRIDLDSTGKIATQARYYDQQGQVHIQPAKVIFGGIWGFNTIRLMLLSGLGRPYDPVGVTGSLGRAPAGYGAGTSSASGVLAMGGNAYSAGNGTGGGFQIEDFKNDNFDHTGLNFISGSVFTAGDYLGGGPNLLNMTNQTRQTLTPAFHDGLKDVKLPTKLNVSIGTAGCHVPIKDDTVDLDPHYNDIYGDPCARLTNQGSLNRQNASIYLAPFAANILTKMGCTSVNTNIVKAGTGNQQDWGHHFRRGMAVGLNPATSAYNKWNQCWDIANYFAAGEITDTFGDETGSGTHLAGPQAYVAAEGIKQYLKSPGLLA